MERVLRLSMFLPRSQFRDFVDQVVFLGLWLLNNPTISHTKMLASAIHDEGDPFVTE